MLRAEDGTVAICLHCLTGLPARNRLERFIVAPQLESQEARETLQLRATTPKTFDHAFLCRARGLDARDSNKHPVQHRRRSVTLASRNALRADELAPVVARFRVDATLHQICLNLWMAVHPRPYGGQLE